MSKIRLGMLSLALLVAASSSARADGTWSWGPACGGNTFATCAAVTVNISASGHVVMTVQNLSGLYENTWAGTVFTQVGIDNIPNKYLTYSALNSVIDLSNNNADVTSDWHLATSGLSGDGIQKYVYGEDTRNGSNGAIQVPGKFQFTFDLGGWQDSYIDDMGFAIHGQKGPVTCSTKLVVTHDGTANQPSTAPDASCGTSVTPEPVSMLLLASGLMGLGGVGLVRRRKKHGDNENA